MQGASPKVIIESISRKNLTSLNSLFEHLPQFLFQFARKALQQQLPTASNLYRWKKLQSPMCSLCGINKPQTNLHVLSNCSSQEALDRYTQRHDNILSIIAIWIASSKPVDMQLFESLWTCRLHYSVRLMRCFKRASGPTLIFYDGGDNIFVLELSVCHESNLQKSRLYKRNKYVNPRTAKLFQLTFAAKGRGGCCNPSPGILVFPTEYLREIFHGYSFGVKESKVRIFYLSHVTLKLKVIDLERDRVYCP